MPSAQAETSANDYRAATVGRCRSTDGSLSICARVNGRNLVITADLTGQVFVPVLKNP